MKKAFNSFFNFNFAFEQGGAISAVDNNVTIYNSVFANNITDTPGTGGGLSFNAGDDEFAICSILNSTFADNIGNIGANIANWAGANANSQMTIQNNILRGDGLINYEIEDGMPLLVSNGGNLVDDHTIDDVAVSTDLTEMDPNFVDAGNFDYHLQANSPAIDAGVADGAPEFDIDGTPRFGNVDIGAYEFDPTSVKEAILENNGMLNIFPNPVHDFTKLELDNDWRGDLEVRLYNALGQEVMKLIFNKSSEIHQQELDVTNIRNGLYDVIVSNGNEAVVSKLTKF